jgi:hypothetical protein
MIRQVTRRNHYVPEWYQRAFLKPGESQLHYLDISPNRKVLSDGRTVTMNCLDRRGPTSCFCEYDLYSTRFGEVINDEVEKFLFGSIDVRGARAVRAFASGDPSAMHDAFQDFFEFIDSQKLRTPKGLDWIKARYGSLNQTQLMVEMQGLRLMHCVMWIEGVREIVSAEDSDIKFIVSDHPVTLYNASINPMMPGCSYPDDPSSEGIGTQTIFVLDANTCLILTHLEYAKNQDAANRLTPRTHARYRGSPLVRTDAFIRNRKLSRDEVVAINFLLKSRARRYLAASDREWLFPEKSFTGEWPAIGQVLCPRDDLWRFGGETYVGYADGSSSYQDAFGRTSGAHEYLRRKVRKGDPRPNDDCGCGSGHKFKRCCQNLSLEDRPTWELYSVRERNLMFCQAVRDILGLDAGKSWQDVQREISDEQVKRIHEAFGSLWPEDTDLPDLLPRPRSDILRAVYLGMSDPRLIGAMILGWLPLFDEVILAHPFMNASRIRPEYSPTSTPAQHKEQTLKNVLLLLTLAPFIHAGYIHLIPDPGDFDAAFGASVLQAAKERTSGWKTPQELTPWQKAIADDDLRRAMLRTPEASMRRSLSQQASQASAAEIDAVIAYAKSELEADPYALLQPVVSGEAGAQLLTFKGYNLEIAMFLATLTGSILYTDLDAHWQSLHLHAQPKSPLPSRDWTPAVETLRRVEFVIESDAQTILRALQAGRFRRTKGQLRLLVDAIQQQARPERASLEISKAAEFMRCAWTKIPLGDRLIGRIDLSVPTGGFERNEVRRLLLTFGRATSVRPIPYAMLIKLESAAV